MGRYSYTVGTWDPSYGAENDGDLGRSTSEIELSVETAPAQWAPVPLRGTQPPSAVLFVDGVRRVDDMIWAEDAERPGVQEMGLAASYAAGVVCCCKQGAHLLLCEVQRGFFNVLDGAEPIRTTIGVYAAKKVHPHPDQPVGVALNSDLQLKMINLESGVSAAARGDHAHENDLLVVDGPLRTRQDLPRALGYVKTHAKGYLPDELNQLVGHLGPHQRTPVFRLVGRLARHSWYLRLPVPPARAPWAGIVRIEASGELSATDAIALADLSQVVFGKYASTEYKDGRAPQNLYPIASLERELKRRLGDRTLINRALRRAVHSG